MKTSGSPLNVYVLSFRNKRIDPFLESKGFSRGMVAFAIPSLGIVFKCRAEGELLDLEFGALFSLLEFVRTSLKAEKIKEVRVFSSNPKFVFAFTGVSPHLAKGSTREKLLREYARGLQLAVGYVETHKNRTLVPPVDYPSLPAERKSPLRPALDDMMKSEYMPFQRGVKF
jgi:hypothetical protein